ncbi:uncharacterized protein TM35_000192270, partial [Trypanosoma theileri]
MMTPLATSETDEAELRQKQFHLALFRLRLLLALNKKNKTVKVEKVEKEEEEEGVKVVEIFSPVTIKKSPLYVQKVGSEVSFTHNSSLHSVDLDEETDVCRQELSVEQKENNNNNNNSNKEEEEEEEDSVISPVIPLPSLLWPIPTSQERLEALEKKRQRQQRRRKERDDETERSWLCSTPLRAIVRSSGIPLVRTTSNTNTNSNIDTGDKNMQEVDSKDTSSLTMTADRSDRCSSQDTYASSHASHDDVYIHELAREYGSTSTPTTATTTTHFRQLSASISVSGGCRRGSFSPQRTEPVIAAVLSNDSTAANTQTEFDQIGSGKAEPYTSYLFSPFVKVLDLNSLAPSVVDNNDSNNNGIGGKDGCTCVRFSPEENCYLIGTQRGGLWFIQIETQGSNTSTSVNTNTNVITTNTTSITTNTKPLMLQGHSAAIMDIAFNNAGTFFASAGADACVILWNKRTRLKVRRINTEGGIPASVHFMPKNNNYLLVSLPQQHLIRLYNSSTGLPVTRKGVITRIELTVVAIEPCADPFLFVGDVNGTITMWRYRVSSSDTNNALPPVIVEERKGVIQQQQQSLLLPRHEGNSGKHTDSIRSLGQQLKQGVHRSHLHQPLTTTTTTTTSTTPFMIESQPHFVKIGSLTVEKGIPVGTLVVSSMNYRQFCSLLHAQSVAQKLSEKTGIKKWGSNAFAGGTRQHSDPLLGSKSNDIANSVRTACNLMLLASFPCDRLVMLCIQPGKSTPLEYKLVPMLVINGACRIRQLSAGTAFCVDNKRSPTVSCTCEEGFVHIITCNTSFSVAIGDEKKKKKPFQDSTSSLWSIMTTLPVPSGGIPCSLAWSPDMQFLVVVTEEGTLYQWQRVNPLQGQQPPQPSQQQRQQQQRHLQQHDVGRDLTSTNNRDYNNDSITGTRPLDEVDEWRIYFKREKERQMRCHRAERRTANPATTGDGGSSDSL